ncbi:MAG: aminotransferase class I/II-fold pyridoxal phosphate-dependent enzyme [Maricaulaceae bacterium]
MAVLDRFNTLANSYRFLDQSGGNPFNVVWDEVRSPTEGVANGASKVLVGTNNYLGLTFSEACIEAGVEALRASGTGTTGSRIANGTFGDHIALEQAIAEFYGCEHAMVFSTGFQANLGVIATVAGPDDTILIDSDSHASIYDACKLSQATILRFRHNDAKDLDNRLRRLGDGGGTKVIVTEGIYSMLGDTAPLDELVDVKNNRGAAMIVDEAHSLGVLGRRGAGLVEKYGLEDQVEFITGTFSKSLGAVGGFCVSSLKEFEAMRVSSRAYMFSASLPPSTIATVRAALEEMKSRPELRARLQRNIDTLYYGLAEAGFEVGPEPSPIVAVRVASPEIAIDTWRRLFDAGFYVNLALSPATPGGISLLRCSVSAAHEVSQLQELVRCLTEAALANGALRPKVAAVAE